MTGSIGDPDQRAIAVRLELSRQRDLTEAILDTLDAVALVVDADGRIVRFNRAAERLTGWTEKEVAGQRPWDLLLLPREAEALRSAFEARVRGDPGADATLGRAETRWRTRDGRIRVLSWSDAEVRAEDGRLAFAVGTGIDITDVRAADQRLRSCLDVMLEGIAILDAARDATGRIANFTIAYLNAAARRIVPRRALGQWVWAPRPTMPHVDLFTDLVAVIEEGRVLQRLVTDGSAGPPRTFELSAAGLGDGVVVAFRDTTDRHAAQERLAWAATHDPLTGLANRPLLVDRLEQALARRPRAGTVVAVLFVDLDGFKRVNDELGHPAGDEVLQVVARLLQSAVRPAAPVARVGGDEFVVVAEDIPTEEVGHLARRLEAAVTGVSAGKQPLQASVGAALARPTDSPESILQLADELMYERKRSR